MEAASTSLRFRNALVFLRHQLRSTYAVRSKQQCRTNVNTSTSPVRKNFPKESISKFINQGLGDMKSITEPTKGLINALQARGFIGQFHGDVDEFAKLADSEVLHMYAGADATATSLHLGHLMVLMPMFHCLLHGHRTTFLVGIATARIGDPAGRATEREGMRDSSLGERTFNNGTEITNQLSAILKNVINHAAFRGYDKNQIGRRLITSNLQWHRNVSIIDFMQIAGHRARIGEMMLKKSVSERMKSKEGISFSEFSYQLIQAMDYWHLFSNLGCRLQIGGSDQWGNITAGCDLINRMVNEADWIEKQPTPSLIRNMAKPYGLTVPLLTTSTGEKFSKSTGGGNIWLSRSKTPPFNLYQFLLNRPDDIVEQYLKYFTLLRLEDIEQIMLIQKEHPEKRLAQRKLAYEVVALIHTELVAKRCENATNTFFGRNDDENRAKTLELGLTETDLLGLSERVFWEPVLKDEVLGQPLEKILIEGKIVGSKTQARQLLQSGGLSMGPHLTQIKLDAKDKMELLEEHIIQPNMVVFKVGKNNLHVIKLESEETIEQARLEKENPEMVLSVKPKPPLPPKTSGQRKGEKRKTRKATVQVRKARIEAEKKRARTMEWEKSLRGIPTPEPSKPKYISPKPMEAFKMENLLTRSKKMEYRAAVREVEKAGAGSKLGWGIDKKNKGE
ncbi:hypothetical protein H072_2133 [Dactylellina haptotyla CBS 200.50]|uniref:Tyrosine--tRNA ligase n=1 Tax=Dactylellina haptotyla (strain CBS 200.50) TaxID=1284197 RepID=S8ASL1_DACHA|nr:hypothetical protein H072_2133 [Dactylellina haptotyla CBS 200.50]